jgi:hypothetical protein
LGWILVIPYRSIVYCCFDGIDQTMNAVWYIEKIELQLGIISTVHEGEFN